MLKKIKRNFSFLSEKKKNMVSIKELIYKYRNLEDWQEKTEKLKKCIQFFE